MGDWHAQVGTADIAVSNAQLPILRTYACSYAAAAANVVKHVRIIGR